MSASGSRYPKKPKRKLPKGVLLMSETNQISMSQADLNALQRLQKETIAIKKRLKKSTSASTAPIQPVIIKRYIMMPKRERVLDNSLTTISQRQGSMEVKSSPQKNSNAKRAEILSDSLTMAKKRSP